MIEQKIIDIKNIEKVTDKENYLAFFLKSFSKGNCFFLDKNKNDSVLCFNNDSESLNFNEEGMLISENRNSKNFVVGFIDKNNFLKIFYYTGNGSFQDIYHNSKKDPSCIIIKRIDDKGDWLFWHESFGNKKFMYLNKDFPIFENSEIFLNKPPNNYYFKISGDFNIRGSEYITLLFFNCNTFQAGSYTGGINKKIKTNIKTDLLIIKNTTSQSNWRIFSRIFQNEGSSLKLNSNGSILEDSKKIRVSFFEDGFEPELNCNSINKKENNYVYLAFTGK